MIALALVALPLCAALLLGSSRLRGRGERVHLAVGCLVTILAAIAVATDPDREARFLGHVRLDATSQLFLVIVNPIFLGIAGYVAYRVHTAPDTRGAFEARGRFALCFLGSCNAAIVANHFTVMWIALEVSTLAAAALVLRPDSLRSARASWHYLLFSTVGLGLFLLGLLCITRGMVEGGREATLFVDRMLAEGAPGTGPWVRLGVALSLLGLGTKLGLAPMYAWLPEAYDEAPPAVAALLGAVQFNAVFVVLLRVVQVFRPEHGVVMKGVLVTMGIVSMVVSTLSIIATFNLKRLIAYESINHAGVLAIGLGVGKPASYGLLLYAVSNAFIKALLFLTAGKIKAIYGTKDTRQIAGLIHDLPYSGLFLMLGTFALLGFPPFSSFFGELLILSALVGSGHMLVFAVFCVLITVTFVATGRTVFPMIWGESPSPRTWPRQTLVSALPKLAFVSALVVLGIYIPSGVNDLLKQVALALEAK